MKTSRGGIKAPPKRNNNGINFEQWADSVRRGTEGLSFEKLLSMGSCSVQRVFLAFNYKYSGCYIIDQFRWQEQHLNGLPVVAPDYRRIYLHPRNLSYMRLDRPCTTHQYATDDIRVIPVDVLETFIIPHLADQDVFNLMLTCKHYQALCQKRLCEMATVLHGPLWTPKALMLAKSLSVGEMDDFPLVKQHVGDLLKHASDMVPTRIVNEIVSRHGSVDCLCYVEKLETLQKEAYDTEHAFKKNQGRERLAQVERHLARFGLCDLDLQLSDGLVDRVAVSIGNQKADFVLRYLFDFNIDLLLAWVQKYLDFAVVELFDAPLVDNRFMLRSYNSLMKNFDNLPRLQTHLSQKVTNYNVFFHLCKLVEFGICNVLPVPEGYCKVSPKRQMSYLFWPLLWCQIGLSVSDLVFVWRYSVEHEAYEIRVDQGYCLEAFEVLRLANQFRSEHDLRIYKILKNNTRMTHLYELCLNGHKRLKMDENKNV